MTPNSANPFDPLQHTMNQVLAGIQQVLETLKRPVPQWETIDHAMKTRRVGRKAIMDLIITGKVRSQQVPSRGGFAYNVHTDDLDQHLPVRNK